MKNFATLIDSLALLISVIALYYSLRKDKIENSKKMGLRFKVFPSLKQKGWEMESIVEIINRSKKKLFVDRVRWVYTFQSRPNDRPLSFDFPVSRFLEPEEIFNVCSLNSGNFIPLPFKATEEIENSELIIDAYITDSLGNEYKLENMNFNSSGGFPKSANLILEMKN